MNRFEHYTDEDWKREFPLLFSIPRDDFRVPEGYFEGFEKQVLNRSISDSTFMAGGKEQPAEDGFSTPPDFFGSMHDEIMKEVARDTPVRTISRKRTWVYWAAAACILGLVSWWTLMREQDKKCVTFACLLEQTHLSTEDLMFIEETDLILENTGELDETDMLELSDDELLEYLDDDLEQLLDENW
ncbi:MAG: hypothetical protein KDC12_12945 [Flavobacteriales bacterium]|nr:hypothetical protein [Flavobacteriales bacterium]